MIRTPLNLIVYNDIFNKIQSNYYSLGDSLPAEQEMEKLYGISRAPIRQALGKLESEGLIVRKPGKGTFVSKNEAFIPWPAMGGFAKEFSKNWNQLRCETLSVQVIRADKEIGNYLSLSPNQEVVYTSRIRYLNEKPIYYLQHYAKDLVMRDFIKYAGNFHSMMNIFKEAGIEQAYASEEISAVQANHDIAEALMIEEGSPVLQIIRICCDETFKLVEVIKYYVLSELWKYNIAFGKDQNDVSI